ncbi:histidine--tRNA ligase [Candidatus Gracilibacteria bacterium]|nr:MAG: histidine--tRNA ligase [Candidatus Gracilibacteria bacterium]
MKNLIPGGFPELLPEKKVIENSMKDIIKSNYEKFGYVNIETPSVELNEVLTSKGGDEVSKQIFGLYGLKQGAKDMKEYALHFDLTVPFARYVVEHENELKFPFKRYQMQKVWRGERQQRGRFKEFTQCDVDVIGDNLGIEYDIEVIHTLYNTIKDMFEFLKINRGIEVHINNRKFIDALCGFYDITGESKKNFYELLDSYYKTTEEEFLKGKYNSDGEQIKKGLSNISGKKFEEIFEILKTDISDLQFGDKNLQENFEEVKKTYDSLKSKGVNVVFDPFITRGLDYYTGTVFETFVSKYFDFGSICSGGRYDGLVGDIRKLSGKKGKNYGGVGGSIGLTRLFARLEDSGLLEKNIPLSDAIVLNVPNSNLEYREKVGNLLRDSGIKTDIYYPEAKLGKQFSYATSKNIPLGIFAGEEEEKNNSVKVKDLDNRDSFEIETNDLVKFIENKLKKIL